MEFDFVILGGEFMIVHAASGYDDSTKMGMKSFVGGWLEVVPLPKKYISNLSPSMTNTYSSALAVIVPIPP